MRTHPKDARGTTLIELMVAMVIAIVGAMGFVATANAAANNSAVSYRRLTGAMLRTAMLERVPMLPRNTLVQIAANTTATTALTWYCLDVNGQLVGTNPAFATGLGWGTPYVCPANTVYDAKIFAQQGTLTFSNTWQIYAYAERTDAPCTAQASSGWPSTRYQGKYCVAGDVFVTE